MHPDNSEGAGGQEASVRHGRPVPAAWWYLVPVGILMLGCVTGGAVALVPTESSRPAGPIAEGQTVTFNMEGGRKYWLFRSADPHRRGSSCEFSGDGVNGLRVGGREGLLVRPPEEVRHAGRSYRYVHGIVTHDGGSVSVTCGGGRLLVEPAGSPRWCALVPLALAMVAAIATAIGIGVRRRVAGVRSAFACRWPGRRDPLRRDRACALDG
jgi:hypothetical protein